MLVVKQLGYLTPPPGLTHTRPVTLAGDMMGRRIPTEVARKITTNFKCVECRCGVLRGVTADGDGVMRRGQKED